MRIPTSFRLGGRRVTVKIDADQPPQGNSGLVVYPLDEIRLSTEKQSEDHRRWVFLHEVVHLMMHTMGREDLRDSEPFVDTLSALLHEFLMTREENPE